VDVSDKRLIEDLLPVGAINVVAQREKIGHAALHPRKLHLWWARRPLAAARAAVYATLVPADGTPDEARSDNFFTALCQWGASDSVIAEARARVLAANGGAPPRVLDLFAGGGAIPLEAARLGCDATAVELNPVAHLIERCTLDYPQRFGPGLADDVREYGRRWVERTWERVGHLYPRVREPQGEQLGLERDAVAERATGRPIAYLWTRTVPCPNSAGGAHDLPLVRQTWLAKKPGRYVALRPRIDRIGRTLSWEVVQAADVAGLGFDPAGFSSRGRASCLVCGAAVDASYVKEKGLAGEMNIMPLAAALVKPSGRGRDYLAAGEYPVPSVEACDAVQATLDVKPPTEPLPKITRMTGGICTVYGLVRYVDLFTPRQCATLCAFAQGVGESHGDMIAAGMDPHRAEAVSAYLAMALDRVADRSSNLCRWETSNQTLMNTYARQALAMVWDFAEGNPFGGAAGDAAEAVENVAQIIGELASSGRRVEVQRTSASQLPDHDDHFDAVITDPPYYDNISYADLSDFFYVWLKRSVGFLLEEHFASELTPKKREVVAVKYRHRNDMAAARAFYEREMAAAFAEAHRVLKPGAPLVCVYAHKTTLGWAALVEALRQARFTITEA
jgi:putative DNA methylase